MPDLTEIRISHEPEYIGDCIIMDSKIETACGDMLIIGSCLVRYNAQADVITIPEHVRTICADAFSDAAQAAREVILPSGLKEIRGETFAGFDALEEIVLPDSVREIAAMAFAGCTRLKTVHLPEHEVDIAENAFEGTVWEKEHRS
ncbi:MAG: leucine-rich repeat domain-containing protein [Oscillospiraceae bacterium]|nr:leucine-rich repeat domain-containing protein [Oscillospiraceae bacterium]